MTRCLHLSLSAHLLIDCAKKESLINKLLKRQSRTLRFKVAVRMAGKLLAAL